MRFPMGFPVRSPMRSHVRLSVRHLAPASIHVVLAVLLCGIVATRGHAAGVPPDTAERRLDLIAEPGEGRGAHPAPHRPPRDTSYAVAGLAHPARVLTDRNGIPHLEAADLPDLYFLWGFVTARDRLFQLEYTRRAAHGTLWRTFGNRTLLLDGGAQLFELAAHARAIWRGDSLDPAARVPLQRYADGINAWIARCRAGGEPWPAEFTRLRWRMDDWSPEDSEVILLGQGVVLDLAFPEYDEWGDMVRHGSAWMIARQRFEHDWIYDTIPDSVARRLYGEHGLGARATPAVDPHAALPAPLLRRAARAAAVFQRSPMLGASNAFAVGPARTTTGAPLLANDPHLELSTPSPFHVVHVTVPGVMDAIGAASPGLPVIVSGRNAACAWGVTALQEDVVDVYADTLSRDGHRVRWQGRWVPLRSAPYALRWRKFGLSLPPLGQRRRYTPHGPVLAWDLDRGLALSVRWAGLDDSIRTGRLFGLEREITAAALCARVRSLITPSLNFVVADAGGDVRYQAAGRVPRRLFDPGPGPLPSDPRFEWQGFIPADSLPAWDVPRDGFVVNGNNRPVGDRFYPYPQPRYDWPQDRAIRMSALLAGSGRISPAQARRVQNDVRSSAAARLAPLLVRAADSLAAHHTALERAALDTVRHWDLEMTRDRVGATIYRAWLGALVKRSRFDAPGLVVAALDGRAPEALRRPGSERPERAAEASLRALDVALKRLQKMLGADMRGWSYGRAHRARFVHPAAAALTPPSVRAEGDFSTVSVGSSRLPWGNTFAFGPAFRHVVDLAVRDSSLGVIPPGNSGDLRSPHARDMIDRWAQHGYVPLYLSWPRAEAAKESELRLSPVP